MKILLKVFLFCLLTSRALAVDLVVADLENRELPDMQDPGVQKTVLPNGIHLFYLRDNELPVIKIKSYFDFGTLHEQKSERGLSEFFMSALRSGGYEGVAAEKVDEELEYHAAKIGSDTGTELSALELVTLKKHADKMLGIYFGLLQCPSFDTERLEIIRKAVLNGILRRNEEPMPIAMREFEQSLYGRESPYAWLSTPETINAISRESLKKFHADHVAPNRLWMAATSPLSFVEFQDLIKKYVGDWNSKATAPKHPEALEKKWEPSLEFIQKPGNQSAIVVGHFGEKRFNPDRFKLLLANHMLGGATFGSKLGDRIRTELGLAYGVNSYFPFDSDYGAFQIITRTKSESTVQTVQEIKNIFSDMVKQKSLTEEELKMAKESILNQLFFEYDSPYNLVNVELKYDYFGYPPKYLTIFPKKLRAVTLEEINEVLPKYFFPDKLKILVVGDRTAISDLGKLGAFVEVPLDEE